MLPGRVSVLKRVTPTSISVAPNSPNALDQVRIKALIRLPRHRGSRMVRKHFQGEAPRVWAMNSKCSADQPDSVGEVDQDMGHDNANRGKDHFEAVSFQPFAGRGGENDKKAEA